MCPYIKKIGRDFYDPKMKQLIESLNSDTPKGDVNYLACMIAIKAIGTKLDYQRISEIRDVFMDVWDEIGERIMHPYERKKIVENGDLPWPKI